MSARCKGIQVFVIDNLSKTGSIYQIEIRGQGVDWGPKKLIKEEIYL